jgi:hypothetical protein
LERKRAAKDLFDIAGHVTGGGNPDWLASHAPAARTAPVVQKLVDAGATMVGKTHTDELSRGIFGENAHYGTPLNPKAPGRKGVLLKGSSEPLWFFGMPIRRTLSNFFDELFNGLNHD